MCDVAGFSRFGLGAVTCGGVTVFNGEPLAALRFIEAALDPVRERALAGLERSERWTPKATHRPKSPRGLS
jgi:hypothetical protein